MYRINQIWDNLGSSQVRLNEGSQWLLNLKEALGVFAMGQLF